MLEFAQWLEMTPLSVTIKSIEWIIPLVQSIHILTIAIVFVSLLTVSLRVVGWIRMDEAFGVVMERFSTWISRGLIILAVTGITLVLGEPIRELMSLSFWLKMGLLAIGITSAVVFKRSLAPAVLADGAEPTFSPVAKSAAMATVLLWLTIIFLGRAIAYDVEVWGALSLSPRA
ncbi:MAG TPA: DUF6644 family protein [Vicinamibacterales bacterium]|nr:DUF6644 family protein [Vicinamibacterales bacterium]